MEEIIKMLITAAGAALVTVIGNNILYSRQRKAQKEDRRDEQFERKLTEQMDAIEKRMEQISQRLALTEQADLSILHERLFTSCKEKLDAGVISVSELETIEALYSAYHALGGNGTGTKLYHDVKDLPVTAG